MTTPKKHHFVPQFLLRRFASDDGKLLVHRIDSARSYVSTVPNLAHRNYGHTLKMPGRDPDHSSLEARMSRIEAEASLVIAGIASRGDRSLADDERETLSWFFGLQWRRSRFLIEILKRIGQSGPHSLQSLEAQTSVLRIAVLPLLEAFDRRFDDDAHPKERWDHAVYGLFALKLGELSAG